MWATLLGLNGAVLHVKTSVLGLSSSSGMVPMSWESLSTSVGSLSTVSTTVGWSAIRFVLEMLTVAFDMGTVIVWVP